MTHIVRLVASLGVMLGYAAGARAGPADGDGAWRRPGALGALDAPDRREAVRSLGDALDTSAPGPILEEALALGARFTSAEVVVLLEEASPSTDEGFELLEYLRHRIVDPENGYDVVRWFSFDSNREEAARVLLAAGPGLGGHVPDPESCAALASGTPIRATRRHAVTGCTVAQVLQLFAGPYWTTDEKLTVLRRVGGHLADRQEAWRLVKALSFEDDRRRAWRLLF